MVERCLREHSPACPVTARIGAVAFIHRFGSSLNEHAHFHCCVIESAADTDNAPDEAPSVSFHAALGLDAAAFADVQARVRIRVLSTFVRRGLIDKDDAAEIRGWAHDGGFSVDGSVRIEGADRTGLERLLRYCAHPPFALEHLHQRDAEHLVYRNPKAARGTASGTRPAALVLTPLELITKIAALVPPPRAHRHRYYGVLAPNASLRAVLTALAPAAVPPAPALCVPGMPLRGPATSAASREEPRHRAVARYLWAILLARIYEALPLSCPICHSQMRIIAFINDAGTVKKILDHIGESTQPPRIAW
ncbi:MAG: transposase [Azonexus sp.]|nr:transposase [Azonexus sp.]